MEDKLIQDSEKLEITDLLLTEEERKNVKELFEILQVFHDVTLEFQAMDFNLKQAYILSKRLAEDFPEVSGYLDPSKWSTFQLAISKVLCQERLTEEERDSVRRFEKPRSSVPTLKRQRITYVEQAYSHYEEEQSNLNTKI